MFGSLSRLVNRHGWIVVAAWLAIAAILQVTAPPWKDVSKDDDVRFFPPGYPSVVGQDFLERGFPDDVASSSVVLVAERADGKLKADDFNYISKLGDALIDLQDREPALGIKKITDYRTLIVGPRLKGTSSDGKAEAALTLVALKGTYVSKQARSAADRIDAMVKAMPSPPGLTMGMTGTAAVGRDMNDAANTSVSTTTWVTIVLVVVILLVVYRSPLLAMIPLATIALSVIVSMLAIALLTTIKGLNFQVINITNIFVIVVLFGAGTDYCLFLIARYREELARGRSFDDALTEAIRQVGGALVASAGTVIVGLGMLWFSTFAKIRYTGPAIALSLAVALLAALTVAPVLLHWLRKAVFWPFRPPHLEKGIPTDEGTDTLPLAGFWTGVADAIVKRPALILFATIAALAPFAVLGFRTEASYNQLADLDADRPSVVGSRIVERYFAVGELGPTTVLIHHPGLDFRSDRGRLAVEELSKRIATLPNVAEVRSISRPLGRYLAPPRNFVESMSLQAIRKFADPRYVSTRPAAPEDLNKITRLDLIFKSDPFTGESLATLDRVRTAVAEASQAGGPLAGSDADAGLSGSTAIVNDLKRVTTADEQRMFYLVTGGVYLVLVLLIRRPIVSLYLIATVILGYFASLGITELVFRSLHNGPGPWVGLDWKVGFFLFVILVAVGEDYNIFLMARIIEEERRHGPIEGTRRALAHTGGIISSCGAIMAGTFLSMLFGSLTALRELGFALGLGVLLDTFVVRPILVPAFVILWHRTFPGSKFDSAVFEADEEVPPIESAPPIAVTVPELANPSRGPRSEVPRPPRFGD